MRFDILTLFPEFFESPLRTSLLGKAQERGVLQFRLVDVREYAPGKHRVTDDAPYGGGPGMVMKVEPIVAALEAVEATEPRPYKILLSPQGEVLTSRLARKLAEFPALALVAGRYEGVDERVREFVDTELSVGDYVLSGGEVAALVVVDAVSRFVPGVVGCADSVADESFARGLLEYPQYTRPPEFRGLRVPEVLLSGDHGAIARWRREQALRRTAERRPDLLEQAELDEEDRAFLARLRHG
ncbi:MAG: tRNA (guanine-N(1)-)-methyltransferase [Candidatus Binatia bacterium]|nr:MAG: tRNA (guanine-N(1)-)-methyltransferase [Candidatus Binatia bacterium]